MTSLQPIDNTGGNGLLPLEVLNAAASLFSLIVESELKGANSKLLAKYYGTIFV